MDDNSWGFQHFSDIVFPYAYLIIYESVKHRDLLLHCHVGKLLHQSIGFCTVHQHGEEMLQNECKRDIGEELPQCPYISIIDFYL